MTDYDVPYECACCGKKTTSYLCGLCTTSHEGMKELTRLRAHVRELEEDLQAQKDVAQAAFNVAQDLGVRLRELEANATRWYLADGTFEVLPEDEVIRRRKEAAITLKTWAGEKYRRLYYQGIVYAVCTWIDSLDGRGPGEGVVCGTYETPSGEVEEALERIRGGIKVRIAEIARLQSEIAKHTKWVMLNAVDKFELEKHRAVVAAIDRFEWSEMKPEWEHWEPVVRAMQALKGDR